jgi:hypothetical protein
MAADADVALHLEILLMTLMEVATDLMWILASADVAQQAEILLMTLMEVAMGVLQRVETLLTFMAVSVGAVMVVTRLMILWMEVAADVMWMAASADVAQQAEILLMTLVEVVMGVVQRVDMLMTLMAVPVGGVMGVTRCSLAPEIPSTLGTTVRAEMVPLVPQVHSAAMTRSVWILLMISIAAKPVLTGTPALVALATELHADGMYKTRLWRLRLTLVRISWLLCMQENGWQRKSARPMHRRKSRLGRNAGRRNAKWIHTIIYGCLWSAKNTD